jgi:hypothetical protein
LSPEILFRWTITSGCCVPNGWGVSAEIELETERDIIAEFYILKLNPFLWHGRNPDGIALPFTFAE